MEPELRRKIEEILGPMYCPEDYSCSEPDVKQYKEESTGRFVTCLMSDPGGCALAVPRNGEHECRCVLRATLLEKLH